MNLGMESFLVLVLILPLFFTVSTTDQNAPIYTVDLDQPPEERWAQVAKDYSSYFPLLLKYVEKIVPKDLVSVATDIMSTLDKRFPYPYADELRGIAKASGGNASLGELVLANVFYDMTAFRKILLSKEGPHKDTDSILHGACTSIVASDPNGMIYHGRNLDYSLFGILNNMTIVVRFKKGNTYYTGTTFAGFIGLLTGCRQGGVSISLNERDVGHWWENALSALKEGGNGLVTLLIRDVLQRDSITFKEAVDVLSTTPLIAPSYLIVAGTGANDGVVITRDQKETLDQTFINIDAGAWYVLETNYDRWKAPPKSDNRRDPGIKSMNAVGRQGINSTSLFQVLSKSPVLNSNTVYTAIMSPVTGAYNTVIRFSANTKK